MIGLVAVTLLCSCRYDAVGRSLDAAEALMEERPDSALRILSRIDGQMLTGESQARHALLLSQAYDKNYIDLTNDSLICIADNFYSDSGDEHYRMLSRYYLANIHMNRTDYVSALSVALNGIEDAYKLHDIPYIIRFEFLLARAYLFSYGQEGAEQHLNKALAYSKQLDRDDWAGLAYINLANLALSRKDFQKAINYLDSAKNIGSNPNDIAQYELLANFGMGIYHMVDSIYNTMVSPDIQAQAYHIIAGDTAVGAVGQVEMLEQLLGKATPQDSADIAGLITNIALSNGDYEKAWYYTDMLLNESSRVITNLSSNSLYQINLAHESEKAQQIQLSNTRQYNFIVFLILVIIVSVTILLYLLNRRKAQTILFQNELIAVSNSFAELKRTYNQDVQQLKQAEEATQTELMQLQEQIIKSRVASQELMLSRFAWIEELGKIYLDTYEGKYHPKDVMAEIKDKLKVVKSKSFISDTAEIINQYRNNIISRIAAECPQISQSELNILVLLCANLSPRIISFILNIIPQSVYNAKSAIKRKISAENPSLLSEMSDVFGG